MFKLKNINELKEDFEKKIHEADKKWGCIVEYILKKIQKEIDELFPCKDVFVYVTLKEMEQFNFNLETSQNKRTIEKYIIYRIKESIQEAGYKCCIEYMNCDHVFMAITVDVQ